MSNEKIEELPPIWFMHDNHTFTKLTGPVEQCLATLERLLNEGEIYGMLCSKRKGFENVHQGGTDDRVNFLNRCKEVLEQHLNKPAEPKQSLATLAFQTPDGWYFEFNNNAVSFTTDPDEAADIIRHLEPDETCTEYFKRPITEAVAKEPIAWETDRGQGLIQYVTDSRYKKFSPVIQEFYRPFIIKSPTVVSQLVEAAEEAKLNIHAASLCSINSMSSRVEMLRLMETACERLGAALDAVKEKL